MRCLRLGFIALVASSAACVQILGTFEIVEDGAGGSGNAGGNDGGGGGGGGGGVGGSKAEDGTPCTDGGECVSGNCVDEVCCDVGCEEQCGACNLAMAEGVCTPIEPGTDLHDECDGGVCDGAFACAKGEPLWIHPYGDDTTELNLRGGLAVGPMGEAVLVGDFYGGTVDFNGAVETAPNSDAKFVLKLDAAGETVWVESQGGSASSDLLQPQSVAIDSSGSIISADLFTNTVRLSFAAPTRMSVGGTVDILMSRMGPDGNVLWDEPFGSTGSEFPNAVTADADGNIVFVGQFDSALSLGGPNLPYAGDSDLFVAKLDGNKQYQWSAGYGDNNAQSASHVAVDAAGRIAVAGTFSGTFDFGGPPLSGTNATFIAVLAADSSRVWSASYANLSLAGVKLTAQGDLIVAGRAAGPLDFGGGALVSDGDDMVVARLSPNGEHIWSKLYKANGGLARGMDIGPNGNIVITGLLGTSLEVTGNTLSGADSFLLKLSGDGIFLWGHAFDGEPHSVGVAPDGRVVVGGTLFTPTDIGTGIVTPFGSDNNAFAASFGR